MEGVGTSFLYAAAIIIIMVAVGLIVALVSGNERKIPRGPVQWMGTLLACLVIGSGIWLIVLTMRAAEGTVPVRGVAARPDQIEDMNLNSPAPDFEFMRVADGSVIRLSDYKGKVIVLNLWATWCAPCLSEIPDLNRIHRDLADSGVVVISISDEPAEELRAFSRRVPLQTISGRVEPSNSLPKLINSGFEIRPTSYIIDRQGAVRKYILGARTYGYFSRTVSVYL